VDDLATTWPDDELPWVSLRPEDRGGDEYAALLAAQRIAQARLAGSAPPPEVLKELTARLEEIATLLEPHRVGEHERFDGMRVDLPGRGHPLLPAYVYDEQSPTRLTGRVTFTRFHLGGNGAVHGGVAPLLFDDVLGHLANLRRAGVARTAYLKVDYRAVTPIDVELRFEATIDREQGRKRFVTGRLYRPDGVLVAEADALFVQLLPGQP
jgi:acyl-coenzyme A thioesterase PaaI-like protein